MKQVIDNVYQITGLMSGQVYVITEENQTTLVDTGNVFASNKIKKQLRSIGIDISAVNNIIVTHSHMDHVANLKRLAKVSGAKVYVHVGDYEAIQNRVSPTQCQQLSDGDTVPVFGGLKVIHIPGHTPGNIALYNEKHRMMITGDNVFNDRNKSNIPPKAFNTDSDLFSRQFKKLLDYDAEILLTGHGPAVTSGGNQIIKELASEVETKYK